MKNVPTLLTLPILIPDEKKINFYFHNSLWCLKKFDESLKGLHKIFWGTSMKCEVEKVYVEQKLVIH